MRVGTILNWLLILAGMVEALWGLGQVYGYLPVKHAMFPLTGSFYNPGPYGGFLAMTFPVCLWEVLSRHHETKRGICYWAAMAGLVLTGVMLPATMSRTAWVAVGISSAFVYVKVYPYMPKIIRRRLSQRCRHWKVIALLLLLAAGTGTYLIKKDSADGRLLMWKVAVHAIAKQPLTGYGWEHVAGAYGQAQEEYFASGNYTETEARVAGSPEYVFNEYLQVAMAWGVPALLVLLWIVYKVFKEFLRNEYLTGEAAALLSLMIFSLASYPFQFLEFILAFWALLMAYALGCRNILRWLVLALVLSLGIYWVDNRPRKNARRMFEQAYALHKAGQWQASTDLLKETMKISSDAMILNIIGKNYQGQGKYKEAEHWFIRSTHRLPNRIYPYYLLAKLYAEKPKGVYTSEKLGHAVRMVMEKEPKVQSTAIREMREEVKRIIKADEDE